MAQVINIFLYHEKYSQMGCILNCIFADKSLQPMPMVQTHNSRNLKELYVVPEFFKVF